jgi:hypothetical protein
LEDQRGKKQIDAVGAAAEYCYDYYENDHQKRKSVQIVHSRYHRPLL